MYFSTTSTNASDIVLLLTASNWQEIVFLLRSLAIRTGTCSETYCYYFIKRATQSINKVE